MTLPSIPSSPNTASRYPSNRSTPLPTSAPYTQASAQPCAVHQSAPPNPAAPSMALAPCGSMTLLTIPKPANTASPTSSALSTVCWPSPAPNTTPETRCTSPRPSHLSSSRSSPASARPSIAACPSAAASPQSLAGPDHRRRPCPSPQTSGVSSLPLSATVVLLVPCPWTACQDPSLPTYQACQSRRHLSVQLVVQLSVQWPLSVRAPPRR